MRKAIFIIALATTIAACNNNKNQKVSAETKTTEQNTETVLSSSELYEKEWKLSELNGKAVVLDTVNRQQKVDTES